MSDIPALALTNSLAIECWLFVTNAPSTVGVVIFRGDTRSGLDPYYVTLEPRAGTSGVLNFVVWGADNINASISAPMPLGAWTHLAATLDDATGLMKLYTNAVVAAQTTTTIRPLGPLDPNYQPGVGIGNVSHQPGPFNYPFRGRIDELSVYSRALSASEIAAIYNAGASGKCPLGVPPSITAQPASQSVLAGSAVTFTVTATGTSPLSYQWRFNGTNNAGATGTSLSLSNVQPAQAGAYAVQISNAYGSTNSANALLTVNTSPSCVTPPSGLVGWWAAEGNALDSIGTNNGTLHNGVGFEFGGGVGWAFSFNGTNSYVGVPDSSALRLTNELTIEFWVKRQDLQANDAIVEKGGDWTRGVQNYGVTLAGSQYGNDLAFLFAGGTRHASGITDLNWHHVAVVARGCRSDVLCGRSGAARYLPPGAGNARSLSIHCAAAHWGAGRSDKRLVLLQQSLC
jgi:hypothetical protein